MAKYQYSRSWLTIGREDSDFDKEMNALVNDDGGGWEVISVENEGPGDPSFTWTYFVVMRRKVKKGS